MRIRAEKTIVPYKLSRELLAAGVPLSGAVALLPKYGLYIPLEDEAQKSEYLEVITAMIDAHDGIDDITEKKEDAKQRVRNIPGWATWDEQQASDWFTANIDTLNIPNDIKTLLRAYGRILLALRDETWPEL